MKTKLLLIIILLTSPLCYSQCEMSIFDVSTIPFSYDTEQVQYKCLGYVRAWKNEEFWFEHGTPCDPDGDPIIIQCLNLPQGATFDGLRFTWTATEAGLYYIHFRALDIPQPDWTEEKILQWQAGGEVFDPNICDNERCYPLSDYGTVVIQVRRVNRPPVFNILRWLLELYSRLFD